MIPQHMLVLISSSFPMQEYLVNLQTKVESPKYRMDAPTMDMRSIAHRDTPALRDMNVLEKWPAFQEVGDVGKDSTKIASDMDNSQIDALRRILTKKLAIIQGPPGTGKTYTSVSAIKILLENMAADAPPIIIAAQTNHAVDQILRHISRFEPEFIRLGGQTTDHDVIKPRTLYELKGTKKPPTSSGTRAAANIRRIVGNELDKVLQPFQSDELISADTFFQNGLLSESQRDSINLMESKWAADNSPNKMNLWCNDRMTKITNLDKIDAYIAQLEEEHENLDEKELEAPDNDDDKFEHLYGRKFEVCPGYRATGRPSYISDEDIKALLSEKQELKAIPDQYRPEVYDFLRRKLTEKTKERVCEYGYRCKAAATIGKIGRWEMDYEYISSSRVIGLTTTGLSKYRGLLSIFGPKIVLIEEAAETLEPYTVAALFDTLQHLILVGDHQQLRANCSCPNLVDDPVNFDISLFERLVKNEVEFTRLNTQRRMRPEIRRLIKHIYPDLVDHSSVMNRPNVSGTGGSNVWWWHHEDEESTDESKSKQNLTEARMIVEFTKYLVWNNISLTKITILTFYNGQKKLLSSVFHQHELFKGYRVKICTVDSYQGEENDLILLSLVRSNDRENIGFLSSINRACVALSRARIGFYIFGNAKLLNASEDWSMVVAELQAQDAIRRYLPLYCPPHKRMINAKNYTDLEGLNGGCDEPCKKMLKCGHKCPLRCHPGRDCKKEDCEEDCLKPLPCGHECNSGCADLCVCHPCAAESKRKSVLYHFEALRNQTIATSNGLLGDGSATICREGSFRDSHTLQDATPAEVAAQRTRWAEFTKSRLGLTAAARSAGSTGEIKSEENVIQDTRSLILKENSGSIATQTPDASRATDDLITLTEATSLDDTDLIDLQTTANFQGDSLI